ncbi:hypothetical protein EDB82DRAFT_557036 [Fusarium venenatum]|uniref:uncharacterized protein n=1 Tax=Fusarium venenatum TaxID=56646 RepID=UPI001D5002CD|nr:hypothetical protein EDB82DRAFT_557036 [Fusarium venenatum]
MHSQPRSATETVPNRSWGATILFTTVFLAISGAASWYQFVFSPSSTSYQVLDAVIKSAELPDGVLLKTRWLNVKPIDHVLTLLVGAFYPGAVGYDVGAKLQQSQFLLSYSTCIAFLTVESLRVRNRWTLLGFSIARALAPSMIFIYIIPTILMYPPCPNPKYNQIAVAFWQPTPISIDLGVYVLDLTVFRGSSSSLSKTNTATTGLASTKHITNLYKVTFVVSAMAHLTTIYILFTTTGNLQLTFDHVLVPKLDLETIQDFSTGMHRIFQWDYWLIFVSAIIWSWLGVYDISKMQKADSVLTKCLGIVAAAIIVDPGATLAYFGIWRENELSAIIRKQSVLKDKKK